MSRPCHRCGHEADDRDQGEQLQDTEAPHPQGIGAIGLLL